MGLSSRGDPESLPFLVPFFFKHPPLETTRHQLGMRSTKCFQATQSPWMASENGAVPEGG